MKKRLSLLMLTALCMVLFTGCGNKYNAESSTVYVEKDGKICSTDVEAFSSDYDEDELEGYVDVAIEEFNNSSTEGKVKKTSLKVSDDKAKLTLSYDSAKVYTSFNDVELFVGTVAEAKEAGYDFGVELASVDKGVAGNVVDAKEIGDELKVAIYKGNGNFVVNGTIVYLSTMNTNLVSKSEIAIANETYLLGQYVPETEIVIETETTEAVTEEILEDEPTDATEDIENMFFDFPEEETEEISQFSSVYTYVIYK